MRSARTRVPGVAVLAVLAAELLAACGSSHHAATATTATTATTTASTSAVAGTLRGLVPQPFPAKPAITLRDTAGHAFDLVGATRGKLTYLFFGYTHCPDACPATMSILAAAVHAAPASVRRKVDVVFVTVDPRRDSGPVLRRWLDHYDARFVGLTGSAAQIETAERAAGIPTAPQPRGKATSYSLVHSSVVLAYSPDGLAHVVYTLGLGPADYTHDMPLLLRYV